MPKRTYRRRPRRTTTKKMVRREVKTSIARAIETKYFDGATVPGTTIDSSGRTFLTTFDPSSGTFMSQGVSDSQYIGSKIRFVGIEMRWQWIYADNTNTVRVVIVQMRGTFIPTGADIFQATGSTLAPISSINKATDNRFRIVYDKTYCVDALGKNILCGRLWISGKKLRQLSFSNSSGLAENGAVYICTISDSSAGAHPGFLAYWRNHYKDA